MNYIELQERGSRAWLHRTESLTFVLSIDWKPEYDDIMAMSKVNDNARGVDDYCVATFLGDTENNFVRFLK